MKFAREGYLPSAIPAVAALVAWPLFGSWAAGVLLLFALAVLLFFRDPERIPEGGPESIISPADGRVVRVVDDTEGHHLDPSLRQCVSIFMSPLNVHINRVPTESEIEDIAYARGQFRAAYSDDAPDVNESNALLIRAQNGCRMVVVQIAGWLARRIICHAREGDKLHRGERFGLIMFGSRVDVHLPADVSVCVAPGDRVSAGHSVIARFSQNAADANRTRV